MFFKWFLAVYYAFFPARFTIGPPIFLPYAFVDIKVAPSHANFVFDELTARFRKKTVIDADYAMNSMVIKTFGPENPNRLHIQYVDPSGAKFGLGVIKPDGSASGHYIADATYLVINLGYAHANVPGMIVSTKLSELRRDAEAACRRAAVECLITTRAVMQ